MIIKRFVRDAKAEEPLYAVIEGSLDISKFIKANPELASTIKDLILEKSQGGSGKLLLTADYLDLLDFLKINPSTDASARAFRDYEMLKKLETVEELDEKIEILTNKITERETERDKELKEIAKDNDLTDKEKELFTAKEKEEAQEEIDEFTKEIESLKEEKNKYKKNRSKDFDDKYDTGYIAICDKVLDYIEKKAHAINSNMMIGGYNTEIEFGSIAISVFGENADVDRAFKEIFDGKEDFFKGNFMKEKNLEGEEIRSLKPFTTNYFNKSNKELYKLKDGGTTMNGVKFNFKDGTVITVIDDEGKTFAQVKDEAIKVHQQMIASKMEAPKLDIKNKTPEFKEMYKVVVGGKEIGCFDSLAEAEQAEAEAKAKEGIPTPEITDADETVEEVKAEETVETEEAVEEPKEETEEEVKAETEEVVEETKEDTEEATEDVEIKVVELKSYEDASQFKDAGDWICTKNENFFKGFEELGYKMYAIKVGDRVYLVSKKDGKYETFDADNHRLNDIEGLDVATLIKLGL